MKRFQLALFAALTAASTAFADTATNHSFPVAITVDAGKTLGKMNPI
jgi:hypothetical protein